MTRELVPPGSKGGYLGRGVIEYVGHPSTATRLHELYHRLEGHEPGTYTIKQLAENEVDAEIFSWEKRGKELNARVGYPAYVELLMHGVKPKRALDIVDDELQHRRVFIKPEEVEWYRSRRITKQHGGGM